jgi:hypothetical protein
MFKMLGQTFLCLRTRPPSFLPIPRCTSSPPSSHELPPGSSCPWPQRAHLHVQRQRYPVHRATATASWSGPSSPCGSSSASSRSSSGSFTGPGVYAGRRRHRDARPLRPEPYHSELPSAGLQPHRAPGLLAVSNPNRRVSMHYDLRTAAGRSCSPMGFGDSGVQVFRDEDESSGVLHVDLWVDGSCATSSASWDHHGGHAVGQVPPRATATGEARAEAKGVTKHYNNTVLYCSIKKFL